jgi:hypothetical protein
MRLFRLIGLAGIQAAEGVVFTCGRVAIQWTSGEMQDCGTIDLVERIICRTHNLSIVWEINLPAQAEASSIS